MVKWFLLKQRASKFWKSYRKSKKGLFGLFIIVFFVSIALAAPFISGYDPLEDRNLAGSGAKPAWFTTTDPTLSLNTRPIANGYFSNELDGWNTNTASNDIAVSYQDQVGRTNDTLGSMELRLERYEGQGGPKTIDVWVTYPFDWEFEGPPARFKFWMYTKHENLTQGQIDYHLFIKDTYGTIYWVWNDTISDHWASTNNCDSFASEMRLGYFGSIAINPSILIFTKAGEYEMGVLIRYRLNNASASIDTKVYIDEFRAVIWGEAFGLLGTDQYGRDIFSQLMWGTQVSLLVGLVSALISVILGLFAGLIAGYLGGVVDESLMRFTDALLVIPFLPLLLVLMAVLGASMWNLIIIMGLLGWMGFSRVIRSQVLSLKERSFVEASRAAGAGPGRVILKHLLPNVVSLAYVSLALSVPASIVAEAALSWLGLGDPSVMSWGRMLHEVQVSGGYKDLWWVIPPGLCIAFLSMSFIMIGYAIDDILNPRLRER